MMRAVLPYPLLSLGLLVMWLLLNGFSLGHLVLGSIIALLAAKAMTPLEPAKPRIRSWWPLLHLLRIVAGDIVRSNIAVAQLVLDRSHRERVSGFVTIPVDLKDRTALTVLAVIITSTPGTAWVEYHSAAGLMMIHVLDLRDEQEWIDLIKNRYERLLMEAFE
ncbi:Na+/H+ antiporter subunit E [Tianweitania sp. BSSL-BM11]|uniref:Na+/H+ antiporter subunit E n=1 Tax=Tianweitania aestuarii TaxID=2814886 RepID=A0ABS5RZB2_9HYPH|nr:Na+/H+ antiporter subunit E [Tianweitania aestuarii]MBS9722366.1 Na+/H+ antiporter subunit E [Tianweitania aestuarii]